MSTTKTLARVLTDEVPGGYRMTLETDTGEIIRVFATETQMEDLVDELDELLGEDDATAKADEETTEEQPS